MKTSRIREAGFTLIEIAVVLVIVGLLIGGIMKGQEMINSAKVKNLGQDLKNAGTYALSYQDKYRSLPGDDAEAFAHVGGTSATTGGTAGNGRIEGAWSSTTPTEESFLFWQHIRLAGIATGTTDTGSADYRPKNAFGGAIGVTSINPSAASWSGSLFACSANTPGSVVRQLDSTMDDGNTESGSVRALSGTAVQKLGPSNDGDSFTVCLSI